MRKSRRWDRITVGMFFAGLVFAILELCGVIRLPHWLGTVAYLLLVVPWLIHANPWRRR
jgi:hypothetical protein